jgi:ABC-type branched-subunit amino acid transport system ATPase component
MTPAVSIMTGLSATGISVDFFGLRALEDVSFSLEKGEILGLIGPNGSGKTTLINVLTGQVRPLAGKVLCNGVDITGMPSRRIARHGIARSFQVVRLFRGLTVAENIETAALGQGHTRRSVRARVAQLLEAFELDKVAHQLADALNYGDERRVEIARALAGDPRFLLLDEPAAGMNEAESDNLLGILARLPAERDLGMLIIDHDMSLILRLCHRLHVLASGRTIGEGDVETVRRLPAVVEAYLGSSGQGGVLDAGHP